MPPAPKTAAPGAAIVAALPNATRKRLTRFAILGAAAFLLAACGGGGGGGGGAVKRPPEDTMVVEPKKNRAPTTEGRISDRTLEVGGSVTIDLSGYFADPDGDSLTYEVGYSQGEDNVRASVSGNDLQMEGVAPPGAIVKVTASDPGGLSASLDIDVSVTPDDSNSCQFANDGECDEPGLCRAGTDTNDCRSTGPAPPANRAPTTMGTFPGGTMEVGESLTIDLSRYFTDPDGDSLTYELGYGAGQSSSVRASVSGDSLRITAAAPPGAAIGVTASDPGGLSAHWDIAVIVNPADHPGTIGGAVTISPGSSVSGSIASADDVDFFRLPLTRPGTVTFWTGGEADTVIALLDSDGNDLSSGRRGAASVIASGASPPLVATAGGRVSVTTGVDEVFAQVSGQPGGSTGGYTLHNSVAENLKPVIASRLSSIALKAGGPVVTVDLKNAFRDPEGGALTFHASFGAGQVGPISLGLTLSGSILSIESPAAMKPGPVSIRITASDPFGLFAVQLLEVKIQPPAAEEPEIGDLSGCLTVTIHEESDPHGICRESTSYRAHAINSCSVRLWVTWEWSKREYYPPWSRFGTGVDAGEEDFSSTGCVTSKPQMRYCARALVANHAVCRGDNIPWRYAN